MPKTAAIRSPEKKNKKSSPRPVRSKDERASRGERRAAFRRRDASSRHTTSGVRRRDERRGCHPHPSKEPRILTDPTLCWGSAESSPTALGKKSPKRGTSLGGQRAIRRRRRRRRLLRPTIGLVPPTSRVFSPACASSAGTGSSAGAVLTAARLGLSRKGSPAGVLFWCTFQFRNRHHTRRGPLIRDACCFVSHQGMTDDVMSDELQVARFLQTTRILLII